MLHDDDTAGRHTAASPSGAELFELLVESSTNSEIFTTDLGGVVIIWNVGAERLFGYAYDDINAQASDVIFTPKDRAAGIREWERKQAASKGRTAATGT